MVLQDAQTKFLLKGQSVIQNDIRYYVHSKGGGSGFTSINLSMSTERFILIPNIVLIEFGILAVMTSLGVKEKRL